MLHAAYEAARRNAQTHLLIHGEGPVPTSHGYSLIEVRRAIETTRRILCQHAAAAQGVELPRDVVGEILGWL